MVQIDILATKLAVGEPLPVIIHPKDGKAFEINLLHTFNEPQLEWFKNGSALNTMAKAAQS